MALTQWIIVGRYGRWMSSVDGAELIARDRKTVENLHVATLVCVRGVEPKLRRNLLSILQQSHRKTDLHVVVDSTEDSAYATLEALSSEFQDRIRIHVLDICNDESGLKPLGLSQVCQSLLLEPHPPDCFVFTDADALHAHSWMDRLLLQLYSNASIGAVTGQRWYLHSDADAEQIGTTVRSLWNIASLPQMFFYRIVWGGSWAITAATLAKSGLLDSWQRSLFEDTMVAAHLRKFDKQTVTVPGLYSFSDDETRLGQASYWIGRQLLDTRMYHPAFPAVLLHGITSGVMTLSPLLFLILLVISFDSGTGLLTILGLLMAALYQISNAGIWLWLEFIGRKCQSALELAPESKTIPVGQRLFALLLTQFLYPVAMLRALVTRQVVWRGIRYRWTNPWKIKRLNYQVMSEKADAR